MNKRPMRDAPSPTSSTDDENAPASSSSMKTSDSRQNLTLARSNSFKRFKAMEDQAKAEKEQEAPKFRSEGRSRSTSSARVAGILHKVSLQFVLGRVAVSLLRVVTGVFSCLRLFEPPRAQLLVDRGKQREGE